MKIEVIKKETFKTSEWSGGTTTEFYLYPKDGSYAQRRFDIRLSSATLDDEEAVFTKLPGVYRSLMLLDGEIDLRINGKSDRVKPFSPIEFTGNDYTVSKGKAVDFNLMSRFKGGYTKIIGFPSEVEVHDGFYAFYCIACDVEVTSLNKRIKVEKGDIIIVSGEGKILLRGDQFAVEAFSPIN